MPPLRPTLWLAGACAAALTSLAALPDAAACSCVGTQVVPNTNGPVPRNVVFAVRTQSEWADTVGLHRSDTPEPSDLEPVTTDIQIIDLFAGQALVLVKPSEPLISGAFYVSIDAISQTIGPYVASSATVDHTPTAPTITTVHAEARDGDSVSSASCDAAPEGYYGTLRVELEHAPTHTAHALLHLRAGDAAPVQVPITRSLDGEQSLDLDTGVCNPLPAILPGETYCATLTTYDLAGNTSTSNEVCTTAESRGCTTSGTAGSTSSALLAALFAFAARQRRRSRRRPS